MAKVLVHIHSGPETPNKVTLGALVAATAATDGHDVTVFFAGDGVHNLAPPHRDTMEGEGTGRLGDHIEGVNSAGGRFVVSGMSAQARGYDGTLLVGLHAEFGTPSVLVGLATAADTVLCY